MSTALRLARRLPAEALLRGLIVVITVGSILAIGGVHPPVMLVVAGLSTLAGALALWLRVAPDRHLPLSGPVVVMLLLAVWSLLQLVPMPAGMLAAVAPVNADVWARSLMPFGEAGPAYAPLSLDPGATWIEVLRWTSYASLFAAAAVLASRHGPRWGLTVVFVAAVIAAAATVGHGLFGAERVFGIYQPSFKPQPWHVGPLLNPNNLAALLTLGALCGLGLLTSEEPPAPRWLLGAGIATLVGVVLTSASRAGGIALMVGVLALGAIAERQRWAGRPQGPMKGARWLYTGTLVVGAALALLAGNRRMWAELLDANVEKLFLASQVVDVSSDFRWLGLGRGAFESVFPAYQGDQGGVVYTHVENFPLQWAVEWGVPVAIAALVALGWYLRPTRLGVWRKTAVAGAFVGVVVVLLQNLLDLGLEVPGLCFALVLTLGTLWGAQPIRKKPTKKPVEKSTAFKAAAFATCAGVALLAASIAGGAAHDLSRDRQLLKGSLLLESPPRPQARRDELRARMRLAMQRHPAEPYFALSGGLLAWQERDQNPMPWLQRALERSRVNGRAHLLLAQVLHRRGHSAQAFLELRLAIEAEASILGPAARLAVRWSEDVNELASVVPPGAQAARTWAAFGTFHPRRELGAQCDNLALTFDPTLEGPRQRLASDLIQAVIENRRCAAEERALCADSLNTHAVVLSHLAPTRSTGAQLQARWLSAIGSPEQGADLLADVCENADDNRDCLRARVEVAARISSQEPFSAAGKELQLAACVDRESCAQTNTWIGDLQAKRGDWGAALSSYERAVRDDGTEERYLKLADAATRAGLHSKALRALESVLKLRGGSDAALEERLQKQRDRLLKSILRP